MPQEIRYVSQRDLENLPEVVKAGASLKVGGFYTIRDMSRKRFLEKLELQGLMERYLK